VETEKARKKKLPAMADSLARKFVFEDSEQLIQRDMGERLQSMECFPCQQAQFVGSVMTNRQPM